MLPSYGMSGLISKQYHIIASQWSSLDPPLSLFPPIAVCMLWLYYYASDGSCTTVSRAQVSIDRSSRVLLQ